MSTFRISLREIIDVIVVMSGLIAADLIGLMADESLHPLLTLGQVYERRLD